MLRNTYDPGYRWWRHERLHRLAMRDATASLARFAAFRDLFENPQLVDHIVAPVVRFGAHLSGPIEIDEHDAFVGTGLAQRIGQSTLEAS